MFQVLYLTHLSKPSRIGWQLTLSTLQLLAEIAQLVEHATENRRVDSSSLFARSKERPPDLVGGPVSLERLAIAAPTRRRR